MPIQAVISQHAEEAAFLWTSRNRAIGDPTYSLKSLSRLDDRVDAHLDALRIAEGAGWASCRAALESGGAGEVFPLAVLAFEAGDRERMRDTLAVGCVSAETRRALIAALGWLDHRIVAPWIERLLQATAAIHRAVGIAACVIHRADPGPVLTAAVVDPDPSVRARSLRAVGELKRADLLGSLHRQLTDDDEACRFWAAWALTLHGDPAGIKRLREWIGQGTRFGVTALQLSLRTLTVDQGREWIRSMAKNPELRKSAVVATGILGDPTSIPWIIGEMRSPALTQLAGEAFSMITGVDLDYRNLDQVAPVDIAEDADASSDTSIDAEYGSHLPWPAPDLVEQWWQAHQNEFTRGIRYLAGQPVTAESARQVLVSGKQRQRAAAAIELSLLEPDEPLFEVRSRAAAQKRRLGVAP
jgi:uncharacterized protein (TIGR02270 family)